MTPRFSPKLFDHSLSVDPVQTSCVSRAEVELQFDWESSVGTLAEFGLEVAAPQPSAGDRFEVFVPEHYEPRYAYPLMIWLESGELAPGEFAQRMDAVSDRNYLGVSIVPSHPGQIDELLTDLFRSLRRDYHINPERVFLLGSGAAGTQALATGLKHPEWFAGIAALSAPWPETPCLLANYDAVRGKRLFLGIADSDDLAIHADAAYAARLLWCAGAQVTTVATADSHLLCRALLRELDYWAMQPAEQFELVC